MADPSSDQADPHPADPHKEGIIERVEEELEHVADAIEARFLAAAQVATGTSSAEVNLAAAALEAIEGPAEEASREASTGAEPGSPPPPADSKKT